MTSLTCDKNGSRLNSAVGSDRWSSRLEGCPGYAQQRRIRTVRSRRQVEEVRRLVNCGFSGTNRTALASNTPKRQLQTSRVA